MSVTPKPEAEAHRVRSHLEGTRDRRRLIERFAPVAEVQERHELVVDAPAELALLTALRGSPREIARPLPEAVVAGSRLAGPA